jgi:hypothetical protein
MIKMSVSRGWRSLSLLTRSRTGEDVTLQYGGFIPFEDTRGYFLFYVIDVSDDAYLTGVYVQWSGLQIILLCVLIYLAVRQHEILQYLARIREGLISGLIVNNNENKYLYCTRKTIQPSYIDTGEEQFEQVNSFKYLGTMVNTDGFVEEEIKEGMAAGKRAFHVHKKNYSHQS